jgi:hypothetical protein
MTGCSKGKSAWIEIQRKTRRSSMPFTWKIARRSLRHFAGLLGCLSLFPATAWPQGGTPNREGTPNVVIQWNNAALQGVRDSKLGPPMVSRALAIVHTCIYDAWAAYDHRALGTQLGGSLRRPHRERTPANKNEAISFAAYRAARDLFPEDDEKVFRPLMEQLGYNPDDASVDTRTASGVGNKACNAVLQFRHRDGSNQLGELSSNGVPYADYTGYTAVNPPSPVPSNPATVIDPNRWQPLQYFDATHTFVTQPFVGAQWYLVKPFALPSDDQFRSELAHFGPATYGSSAFLRQVEELVKKSANLTDREKMIAEYFADGPHSELPPGHWDLFAQFVSIRDHHGVDEDAKLFFALTNAIYSTLASLPVMPSVRSIRFAPRRLFHTCFKASRSGRGAVRERAPSRWMAGSGFRIR